MSYSDSMPVSQRDFDRLVDGELTLDEQRELLSQLDHTPDGWRRCALTFVESQVWRSELAPLARPQPTPSPVQVSPASTLWSRTVPTVLAMTASFLLAFVLGLVLRGGALDRQQIVADVAPAGDRAVDPSVHQLAAAPPAQTPMPAETASAVHHRPAAADSLLETIWLPAAADDADLYANLPEELARDLARLGHEIERCRELWPVQLEDGRRAVLPIDRFDVRYVGYEYQ